MEVNKKLADALWYGKREVVDHYFSGKVQIAPHPSYLHGACRSGMTDIVRQLLDGGCVVNWGSYRDGWPYRSALAIASEYGNTEIIDLLLKHGAAPEGNADDDFSPLYHCVRNDDLKGIGYLVRAGADMHRQIMWIEDGLKYDSPYDLAKREHHQAASRLEKLNQLSPQQMLSRKRAFMNTEMFRWCHNEGRNLDSFILRYGADVNAYGENGETLLHHAVRDEDTKLAWKLMYYCADLQIKNRDGMTPLELEDDLRKKDTFKGFRSDKVKRILTEKPTLFPHAAAITQLLRYNAPRNDMEKAVDLLKSDVKYRNALDACELFSIVHWGFDPDKKLRELIDATRGRFETSFCCRTCGRFTLDRGALTAGSDISPAASNEPEWDAYCHSCGGNTTVWR